MSPITININLGDMGSADWIVLGLCAAIWSILFWYAMYERDKD